MTRLEHRQKETTQIHSASMSICAGTFYSDMIGLATALSRLLDKAPEIRQTQMHRHIRSREQEKTIYGNTYGCSRPCYSERFSSATFRFEECARVPAFTRRRRSLGEYGPDPMGHYAQSYLDHWCLSANSGGHPSRDVDPSSHNTRSHRSRNERGPPPLTASHNDTNMHATGRQTSALLEPSSRCRGDPRISRRKSSCKTDISNHRVAT